MRMRCVCASYIHCVLLANNRCVLFIICFRSRLCPFPFCFARDCFSLYIFTIQKGNLMYFYSDISQENHRFTEVFCVFTPISWLSWGIRWKDFFCLFFVWRRRCRSLFSLNNDKWQTHGQCERYCQGVHFITYAQSIQPNYIEFKSICQLFNSYFSEYFHYFWINFFERTHFRYQCAISSEWIWYHENISMSRNWFKMLSFRMVEYIKWIFE